MTLPIKNRRSRLSLSVRGLAVCVGLLSGLGIQGAEYNNGARPQISIIIDDMGYGLHEGREAIALPGPLAYSILPFSPNGNELALEASRKGKEVLLHMPMQSTSGNHLLEPSALTIEMSHTQFVDTLQRAMMSVPLATGINNHMGSLLTRHPGPMQWLIETIREHGYFFVDSRTTPYTVAADIARRNHVPNLTRDVFLDNVQDATHINAQFERLVALAKQQGTALAIAHPHPKTIAVLSRVLPSLSDYGVHLVSLREMIAYRTRSDTEWQLSLSRSQMDAKN